MRDKFQFVIYHVRVILLTKYNCLHKGDERYNYANRIKVSESIEESKN